jgi:predicted restriction endonuclease
VYDEDTSVENSEEIFNDVKKRYLEYLGPRVDIDGDPLIALMSSFKTQGDFSLSVRKIYKGKCALRESFIYKDHPIGLEAAHVHAKTNGGNFLPSNGILLSTDLHRAFDEGIWTLDNELRVVIHEKIQDGLLLDFNRKKIAIPEENIAFKPFEGYLKWHRENRFGLFTRLGS